MYFGLNLLIYRIKCVNFVYILRGGVAKIFHFSSTKSLLNYHVWLKMKIISLSPDPTQQQRTRHLKKNSKTVEGSAYRRN